MKTFALVCEGGTDQRFLEHLLHGLYGNQVQANPLQPVLDATDQNRQGNFGGWENVFAFLERMDSMDEVFATNDYLIIQIDTDVCEHVNFGVGKQKAGENKTTYRLILDVRERLIEKIGIEVYAKYEKHIAFAICVHSLECWLLPLHAKSHADQIAVLNCEERLARAFAAKDEKYEKDSIFYRKACKPLRKKDGIELCYSNSESFRHFHRSLPPIAMLGLG
jgi:hypothetical protein